VQHSMEKYRSFFAKEPVMEKESIKALNILYLNFYNCAKVYMSVALYRKMIILILPGQINKVLKY
jgi:hypothetical protein